jgi:hypothetical protein
MAAAYKPELAATLGSCMQDMMHDLKAGLEGQPTSHRLLSWADVTINKYVAVPAAASACLVLVRYSHHASGAHCTHCLTNSMALRGQQRLL